ncbi:MAG: FAD-binding protein, partial [Solirubrobacterales bacterium]
MDLKKTITLELLLAGDGVSGRALGDDGDAREFSGRLGLMHTIDELLAGAGATKEATMNPTETLEIPAAELRRLIGGPVMGPGDEGYDTARGVFNLTIDQRPALIAEPGSREEVAAVVRFAAANGLRVAPQRTGHNAGPLGSLERSVLLKTNRLNRVSIDNVRTVRFLYCDHANVIRGKAAHVAGLADFLESGIGLTVAMQGFTLTDHLAAGTNLGAVGEIRLVPDPRTFAVLPYASREARLLCD